MKTLYIDMDNTLVDFASGLQRADPDLLAKHAGDEDEIPGIFALMDPMPGAVEAFHELSGLFDTYILSTAPWKNPTAWHDKVQWIHDQIGIDHGTPAYKRLILSHHKHLNRGEFLVDDRPTHNGADRFEGEVIPYGAADFPDWPTVVAYLKARS